MKPIGVLVNPASNRGGGVAVGERVKDLLNDQGIPVINLSAQSAQEAFEKAQLAIRDQEIFGLVAVGGDGTAQLGVNICIPNQIPFGLVPAGSGNDQARELNIKLGDPAAAVAKIIENLDQPRRIDAMRVSLGERSFWSIGSISAGFDAVAAKRANSLSWPKGPNSYIAALFLELPSFNPISYQLTIDGEHRSIEAMLCGVANVKNFGGGMRISPNSEINDGELEVFILHKVTRPKLLRIFPTVYSGSHLKFPEVEILRAKSITISNSGFPVSCDGELVGIAPVSVEIHPGALAVLD